MLGQAPPYPFFTGKRVLSPYAFRRRSNRPKSSIRV